MAEKSEENGEDFLPFKAEYAKSGRSSCRQCKKNIEKGAFRIAAVVQSTQYGGKTVPNWYHNECFFEANRIKSVADVENFAELLPVDQKMIEKNLIPHGQAGVHASILPEDPLLQDYNVDTAKSARSVCRGCTEKIAFGATRICKKDHDSDKAKRYSTVIECFYHLKCFADKRDEFEFYAGGEVIPGFESVKAEIQEEIKQKLPVIKVEKGKKRPKVASEPSKKMKRKTDK